MELVTERLLAAARKMTAAVEAFALEVEQLATVEFGSLEAAVRVLESRECVVCGEEFTRGTNEQRLNFEKRLTCRKAECLFEVRSRAGKKGGKTPRQAGRPRLDLGPRTCVVCGVEFVRREDEDADKFRKRETCSREHGRVAQGRRHRKERVVAPVAPPAPVRVPPPRPVAPPLPPKPVAPPLPPKPVAPPVPVKAQPVEPVERWRPPVATHEPVRMVDLGPVTYCEQHPGNTVGVYGCTACNAGKAWSDAERARPLQPRFEGGR